MKREILLLDVTEMSGVHVCVAGWDVARRTHARLHQPATSRWLVKQPACWLQVTNAFARPRAHFR